MLFVELHDIIIFMDKISLEKVATTIKYHGISNYKLKLSQYQYQDTVVSLYYYQTLYTLLEINEKIYHNFKYITHREILIKYTEIL